MSRYSSLSQKEFDTAFAAELRHLMNERAIKLPEAAEMCGVGYQIFRRIVKGHRPATAYELLRISEAFGIGSIAFIDQVKTRAFQLQALDVERGRLMSERMEDMF